FRLDPGASVKKVRNCIGAADRGKYRRAAGAITKFPLSRPLGLRAKKIGRLPNSNFGCQCLRWVIHVIPAIPACPVCSKTGHWAYARVYEYTAYGAAENMSPEIKTLHPRRAPRCRDSTLVAWYRSVRTSHGRGV